MIDTHVRLPMKIISLLIDALFPPRLSEIVVRKQTAATMRHIYQPGRTADCIYLTEYKNNSTQALITENKFYRNGHASKLLGELVSTFLETQTKPIVLIPVPLGKQRKRERGYNQVTEILKQISNVSDIEIREDICFRNRETIAQLSLPRKERLHNVVGAFRGDAEILKEFKEHTLIVVDDVSTTGATLQAVKDSLLPHLHASNTIICLAIAH